MAIYSVNQVRHLYVVKANEDSPSAVGDATFVAAGNGGCLMYKGPGGLIRSDIIPKDCVLSASAIKADDLSTKLPKYTITLDSAVNGGAPVVGQEYILNMNLRGYISPSPTVTYLKFGAVKVTSDMTTASKFYAAMAVSLAHNFSREPEQYFTFKLGDTVVTPQTKLSSLTGTYTGIVIEENHPGYIRGKKSLQPHTVEFSFAEINDGTSERSDWGNVAVATGTTILNGYKVCDLEYFAMAERGDVYKMANYPNNWETTYVAVPSSKYDMINIHYSFVGDGVTSVRSEKDIQIAVEANTDHTVTDALIDSINTVLGTSIEKLTP